jgi:hypothetical protein
VSSYLTVSPLPTPKRRRSVFCCAVREVAPARFSPAPCPAESGLSSSRSPRPPGRLLLAGGYPLPVTPSLEHLVHADVRESVGVLVPLAGNMLETDLVEAGGDRAQLAMQDLQVRRLHAVLARHLLDQKLTVGAEQYLSGTELGGSPQAFDRRRVLRDVVRRVADATADLGDDVSARVRDVDADARRAGVPASRPIAGDDQKIRIRRQWSHLLIPSARFNRSTSTADSCSWQP